jgi:hypothetical protein
VSVVSDLVPAQLDSLLADSGFMERLAAEVEDLDRVTEGQTTPDIAYCSPEFGIDVLLPQIRRSPTGARPSTTPPSFPSTWGQSTPTSWCGSPSPAVR